MRYRKRYRSRFGRSRFGFRRSNYRRGRRSMYRPLRRRYYQSGFRY